MADTPLSQFEREPTLGLETVCQAVSQVGAAIVVDVGLAAACQGTSARASKPRKAAREMERARGIFMGEFSCYGGVDGQNRVPHLASTLQGGRGLTHDLYGSYLG